MTSKPEPKLVDVTEETPNTPTAKPSLILPDPFADLASLRLDQSYTEIAGVKKRLTTVPVRKPGKQDYVRVHTTLRLMPAALIELKDDREMYLVAPNMVEQLTGEWFAAALFLTITSVLFLWPVKLPGPDGRQLEWYRSAMDAAEAAQKRWIRVVSNMSLGAYDIFEGSANIPILFGLPR
jgi:hypothetical protein